MDNETCFFVKENLFDMIAKLDKILGRENDYRIIIKMIRMYCLFYVFQTLMI